MTSHREFLSGRAAGRALCIGLAACLLATTGACSSTSEQAGDATTPQGRTSDAADLGPAIAPTWLPGIAPAAGGNPGDERDGAAGEADVADQGIWTSPSARAARSAAPRTSLAAMPSRGAEAPASEARPPRAAAPDAAASAARASPADAEAFAQRGDELLQTGDVVGARFCYERAAAGGMAAAATRVGKTYDPIFLATVGVQGLQGDPSQAAVWYRKGISAGDPEALQRLSALSQMVR